MPPSTRRVAHVPSWVDENITITALSNHVIGDASDENETLQQQEDRPLVTSSSSVHINVNTLRFLMANRRNLATSRSQCGRRDDELRDLPAAPSACRESDAIVALEHAMAKADDARYYNNRCAGATGEIFREDEKEVPPRTSIHHDSSNHHQHQHHGSYRQPENPINAVSTYHTHARSSVADVHQLFSSPPPPLPAMAMAVSSSSPQQLPPGQQANNVNALEEDESAHNHSTASTSPPPPPLFNTMDNSTMLSTQDLMLQLAARGAIRDSTLREFLKFTPTPLTALAMTTLNARNVLSSSPFGEDDEDDNMFDAVYGGGGGGFAKVSVTRQQALVVPTTAVITPPPQRSVLRAKAAATNAAPSSSSSQQPTTARVLLRPANHRNEQNTSTVELLSFSSAAAVVVPLLSRPRGARSLSINGTQEVTRRSAVGDANDAITYSRPPEQNIVAMATNSHADASSISAMKKRPQEEQHPTNAAASRSTVALRPTAALLSSTSGITTTVVAAAASSTLSLAAAAITSRRRSSSLQPQSHSALQRWAGQHLAASQEEEKDYLRGVLV